MSNHSVSEDSRSALSRARFFLRKAREAPTDSREDYEAFLEAAIVFARAALHRFKDTHDDHPYFKAWWDGLLDDASVSFFRIQRNLILKEASPAVGQKIAMPALNMSGEHGVAANFSRAGDYYYFESPPIPADETVARRLDALSALLADAEKQFV